MNPYLGGFLLGIVTVIAVVALLVAYASVRDTMRARWRSSRELTGASLAARRSIITRAVMELSTARHVTAFRLPGGRLFILRSTPVKEYDWATNGWIIIGNRYDVAEPIIGRALDDLGICEALPDADAA